MKLLEIYDQYYKNSTHVGEDYSLVSVSKSLLIGEDKDHNVSLVIKSSEPRRDGVSMKTKLMSFECNVTLEYTAGNNKNEEICHIIKCFSKDEKDIKYFLKLCEAFFSNENIKIEEIVDKFYSLNDLFCKNTSLSQTDMEGLFGELYTVYHFYDKKDLSNFYQKRDKQKFDFSIDENTKIEVKTTFKKNRIHRFRHEQLYSDNSKVYLISYKLERDESGMSLYSLIEDTIEYFSANPYVKARLISYIRNEFDIAELDNFRINENYLLANMKIYDVATIPHFKSDYPRFVSGAEYDSDCDAGEEISEDCFISDLG